MLDNLLITNAPADVVMRPRERTVRHNRSLQGELMAIIEGALGPWRPLTLDEVLSEVRQLGPLTLKGIAGTVREDRDAW